MQSEGQWEGNPIHVSEKRLGENSLVSPGFKRQKLDCETGNGRSSQRDLTFEDYTVGWVCALHIEMAAATCMLDEIHENLEKSPNDSNTYVLGRLHHHNVVIACLPTDGYDTNNAAIVASHMHRTFPSIREFLMVGIGGGVPGKVDIRLGDVVVSTGVIQDDLGKIIQEGRFQAKGTLRQPSPTLRAAVSALRAKHESEFSKIPLFISQMRERYRRMIEYTDREHFQDVLFDSAYEHDESIQSCDDCDRSRIKLRSSRNNDNPVIYYGTIASGNQVIKHGQSRDRLAEHFDAICFEMEAVGFIESLQCLVIRGICDYSDSHKSKEWQKYASTTAAAYTKELLYVLSPIEVQARPATAAPPLRIVQGSAHEFLEESVQERRERRKRLMDSLLFKRIDARHTDIGSAYDKTCAWLLSYPDYVGWLTLAEFPRHHGFLWIRGKLGAGKSTLMKHIYTRVRESEAITILFFFNARGEHLEKSTEGMYRSLLFQLLKKLPQLQAVLDPDLDRTSCFDQDRDGGLWQIKDLRDLFSNAIGKLKRHQVICFVDALDECSDSQVQDMVEHFEELGESAVKTEGKLYICFSSRHYPTICIRHGRTLTLENQPGHGQDLENYVRNKLQTGRGREAESVRTTLLEKAAGVFMWVVLVVNILNQEYKSGRIFAVKKRLEETPAELSALFKDILRRDNKNMADLLLGIQWILYAKELLTPEEFYFALVSALSPESLSEWNHENVTKDDINRFVSSSSKGLAEITKSESGTVQFIHESVRDFLLKDGGIYELWTDLEPDFQSQSHNQLKLCCYAYLKTDISRYFSFDQELPLAFFQEAEALRRLLLEKFLFLEYATS
ncbi:hypothetical protein F4777DRAFT_570567 [Nemania sp. FL0916]|nr:hypothetical protein F4777DRAFT_570567 [Nemania sp. FL0916]